MWRCCKKHCVSVIVTILDIIHCFVSYLKDYVCSDTILRLNIISDCLCGLVVRVLGYRSGGPGSIPGTTRKKMVVLERGPLNLVSTTEELLDRKVAAPV
jgi:hypothetical protein